MFVSFHTGFVLSYDVKRKVIMEVGCGLGVDVGG
jgi:hypothetical protein